tara:strand:+ start:52 stop:624 length:573 start_codon:yes stop_codon:yes gene_type:complete
MPSDLQVNNIKDGSATKTLAEYSSSAWNWGSNVPSGTVLQVQHGELKGTKSTLSASYQDVIAVNITTKVASSKILAMCQTNGSMNGDNSHIHYRLYNVTTDTVFGAGDDAGNRQGTGGVINNTTTGQMDHLTIVGQDSPAQNAGTTLQYKLIYKSNGGTTVYINRSHRDNDGTTYDGRGFTSLTLMEIAP